MARTGASTRFAIRNWPYSYYCDGTGDFASLGNNYSKLRTDAFSVGTYFRASTWGATNMTCLRKAASSPLTGWSFHVDSTLKTPHMYLSTSSSANRLFVGTASATPMELEKWYFIGWSYDGTSDTNGVNMVLVEVGKPLTAFATKETPITNNLTGDTSSSVDLRIGGTSDGTRFLNGRVQGVFIANAAMTIEEFQNIYYHGIYPSSTQSLWFANESVGSGNTVLDEIGAIDGTLNGTTATAWSTVIPNGCTPRTAASARTGASARTPIA